MHVAHWIYGVMLGKASMPDLRGSLQEILQEEAAVCS